MVKSEGKNLLDVGCGRPSDCMSDGAFLSFMGYGSGIDIACRSIDFPFRVGSAENIPFPDKSFDVVTLLEVIEHVKNPESALKEIHRVLKDDGLLVMSTPDNHLVFRTMWWVWERFFDRTWKDKHISSFPEKAWARIIKNTNLYYIEEVRSYLRLNSVFKLRKL